MPWRRALSLRERLERGASTSSAPDPAALRRAERWRGQAPFDEAAVWQRRLAIDGLDEDRWLALASSTPLAGSEETPPPWWSALLLEETPEPASFRETGLLALIEPDLAAAGERWRQAIAARKDSALDHEGVFRSGLALLRRRLVALLTRTLVLELQIARLEDSLQGDTPEERFQSFVARLRLPAVRRDLAEQYPVLIRLVAQEISDWLRFSESWLGHFAQDRQDLVERCFAGQDPGPLIAVERELGDRHRGGRTVLQLLFASGRRLVYKPRSLALEETFRALLQEVGDGLSLPLLLPRGLDADDHGWVEWLDPVPCTDPLQVERFFHRMGLWLGLFHLLGGTDLHADNLLAMGEHPVPLDLETLFHPVLPHGRALVGNAEGPEGSVLRVGLLPQRVQVFADGVGLDWSGLGAIAGQTAPRPSWQMEAAGTEDMRMVPRPVQIGAPPSLPTLDGETRTAADHVEAVVAGYREVYGWMLYHRGEWLGAPGHPGHLDRFAGLHRRIVLRPTQLYGRLLVESRHPQLLQDALDRDAWFDRLWLATEGQPWMESWIPAERHDLEQGDVPIFSGRCDGTEIEDGAGTRHADALAVSGLDEARQRIARLSGADRLRQEELVRRTLVLHGLGSRPTSRPGSSIAEAPAPPSAEALLAWSRAAAERLAERAFPTGDGGVTWMVPRRLADHSWTLTDAAPDLYFGSAGIALFLAHLGHLTGDAMPAELSRAAVRDLLRRIDQTPPRTRGTLLTSIGAFDGWGSVVYTLVHLARLWNDPTLLRALDPILDILEAALPEDAPADLLSGRAGAAMALLIAARAGAGPRALELARRYGELLTGPGDEGAGGLGWRAPSGGASLTGFSHGTAGIAWVLLELAAATGDASFTDTAHRALAYERALFSPEAGNWPDLRERPEDADGTDGTDGHFLVSWCHGAPGVALGRLAMGPFLGGDPHVAGEIEIAVATTLRSGFGLNHSLCHGDLGNLDILLEVARARGDRGLEERVGRLAGGVVRSLETEGWLYGSPLGTEPPGLMVGLAGIGYGCLRLAAPDRIPCLLRLSLPGAGSALD
jgi:type 2 lantibiotic biosynthesis protein LanM